MANDDGFYLHIEGFDGFDKGIDFEKKEIRRAMRAAGLAVQQEARALVGKNLLSQPGHYPGRRKGVLRKSIGIKVSRAGFLVRIGPQKISAMRYFYPAFLYYGVKRKPGVKRDKRSKGTAALRIEPRGNYMADALQDRSEEIRRLLGKAFSNALVIK